MNKEFDSPFDVDRLCGSIVKVSGAGAVINLPFAASPQPRLHLGNTIQLGAVGEYVVVECGHWAILGRIDAVRLPERERLAVEDRYSEREEANPLGEVSLLASVDLSNFEVYAGVTRHPRLGATVYSAHSRFVSWIARRGKELAQAFSFSSMIDSPEARVEVTPTALLGRHCAIVGSTGMGKSFTLATIVQKLLSFDSKILLLDSTGEFASMDQPEVLHCSLSRAGDGSQLVRIPYTKLRAEDMFTLFRPGAQVASVKLRDAAKHLRVASADPDHEMVVDGLFDKRGQTLEDVQAALDANLAVLEVDGCEFDITLLSEQINLECLKIIRGRYGNEADDFLLGHVSGLQSRIGSMVKDPTMSCLFGDEGHDFILVLEQFMRSSRAKVLRLALNYVTEANNCPAVIVNAVSRLLLSMARSDMFRERPLVFAIDEAHRYIGREVTSDELHRLDGLEMIAKEGRKSGLYMLLSTQQPRDLGRGVISQVGTIIAHRLTHPDDRKTVEHAAGDFATNATSILAGLSPGQAILLGVEFPVPITVQLDRPHREPASNNPEIGAANLIALEDFPILPDGPEVGG